MAGRHDNQHLQHAWNKYGANSFSFEVSLVCGRGELVANEQLILDRLRAYDRTIGYNIRTVAHISLGLKRTAESKRKQSESGRGKKRPPVSQETKDKLSKFHAGKTLSEAHKLQISLSQKRVLSRETLERIRWRIWEGFSNRVLAGYFGVSVSTIQKVRSGRYGENPAWNLPLPDQKQAKLAAKGD